MRKNKNKGFSMVELTVVIAIMVVLLAILVPSVVRYTENSRMQRDESAMDEVCNSIFLAMADADTFDEVFEYAIPNNYITYTDSSGVYGARYTDEEFWAPDGSGEGVTITFNPDENGDYHLSEGIVNDMTLGNGSVAESRATEEQKAYFSEMGTDNRLYTAVNRSIDEIISYKSTTYKYSSYTVFIIFDLVDGTYRPDVYGLFNGTNLTDTSPASLGSGTESYTPEGDAIPTKPGGTTTPNIEDSDLEGGGTSNNTEDEPDRVYGEFIISEQNYSLFSWSSDATEITIPEEFYLEEEINRQWTEYVWNVEYRDYDPVDHTEYYAPGWYKIVGIESIEVESYVFSNFPNLQKINLPNTLKKIGYHAFTYCENLESITIPDSVTYIGESAFCACNSLTSVIIPNSVTEIDFQAFCSCDNLQSVIMPETVTKMGTSVFRHCYALQSVQLPNNLTEIPSYTFYFCESLESIDIPNSVTVIGRDAFCRCLVMNTPTMPSQLREIQNGAFFLCENIKFLELPDTVQTIGVQAFAFCSGLEYVTIADNNQLETIGGSAFQDCTSLSTVTLGENCPLTSIGSEAFINCSTLSSIVIPYGVTTIGNQAFRDCTSMTAATFENTEGWWFQNANGTGRKEYIASSRFENSTTAANYLNSSYYSAFKWSCI